jgi:hypothetical protein
MLIRLGAATSVMVQYLLLRGDTYYFHMRVPLALEPHYGKKFIRQSLRTTDRREAAREVEKLARKQQAEFKALSGGKKLTPAEVTEAALSLAEQYDLEHFIDYVINPHANFSPRAMRVCTTPRTLPST